MSGKCAVCRETIQRVEGGTAVLTDANFFVYFMSVQGQQAKMESLPQALSHRADELARSMLGCTNVQGMQAHEFRNGNPPPPHTHMCPYTSPASRTFSPSPTLPCLSWTVFHRQSTASVRSLFPSLNPAHAALDDWALLSAGSACLHISCRSTRSPMSSQSAWQSLYPPHNQCSQVRVQ